MKRQLDEFIIPLTGSTKGVSEHSFSLNKSFFDHFEDDEILDSNVEVTMTLKKEMRHFEMDFNLNGILSINCDRCLEPMNIYIDFDNELIVKYGERYEEVDDKVVTIGPNEDEINIASFVFEYAKLALPIQRVHDEDDCDSEMLEQMAKYEKREEIKEEKETDSRWDALAGLKDKLE